MLPRFRTLLVASCSSRRPTPPRTVAARARDRQVPRYRPLAAPSRAGDIQPSGIGEANTLAGRDPGGGDDPRRSRPSHSPTPIHAATLAVGDSTSRSTSPRSRCRPEASGSAFVSESSTMTLSPQDFADDVRPSSAVRRDRPGLRRRAQSAARAAQGPGDRAPRALPTLPNARSSRRGELAVAYEKPAGADTASGCAGCTAPPRSGRPAQGITRAFDALARGSHWPSLATATRGPRRLHRNRAGDKVGRLADLYEDGRAADRSDAVDL